MVGEKLRSVDLFCLSKPLWRDALQDTLNLMVSEVFSHHAVRTVNFRLWTRTPGTEPKEVMNIKAPSPDSSRSERTICATSCQ